MSRRALAALGLAALLLPQAAQAEDAWTFKLVPYVWMTGLSGDVGTLPPAPPANIDLSFRDVLENLDMAAFVVGEARHGDFFLVGEMTYAKLSTDGKTPGPFFSGVDLTATTFMAGLGAGYTLNRGERHRIDAWAGARIWSIDTELKLKPGILAGQKASDSKTFVDPVVGAMLSFDIAPDWILNASGSIGGFGAAADLEWGVTGSVTYQISDTWGVVAGYRYLAVDYDRNGFVFDVSQSGPLIGTVISF